MTYKFDNIKIIDFVKLIAVTRGISLRKLIGKIAEKNHSSDCYSSFYAKLKKETIKFSEIKSIADILGYEIIFTDKS